MNKLENRTVLITGGLSGIGKACAIAAAKEGAIIIIADLKCDKVDAVLDEIKWDDKRAIFIDCDVSNFLQVKTTVDQVVTTFGKLDVALNNAGIAGEAGKVGDMSEEAWLQVINVNLNGVFNGMKHQLTHMLKQKKGVIVNMSSILGKVGFPSAAHYVASKHAIIGLTKTAALEYAQEGIRINAICPGFIDTPLLANGGITDHSDVKNHIVGLHPMLRMGTAEEIAAGFIFLASDDSSFVTGTSLEIEGGYLAQ